MENQKFNKLLNEKYFLMQEIARKYDYNEELLDIITFVYVSFYMDYGKKVDLPLYDLFDKVRIIYEYGNVGEIAERHHLEKINGDAAAVTYFIPNLEVFNNPELKQNPQLILLGTHVGDFFATASSKLEMVTHEVRHALMGYYNTNLLINDDTYYMRSGMHETFYKKDQSAKNGYQVRDIGRTLDEIMNTYISELLVARIRSYMKYDIDNAHLKMYLKTLKTKHEDDVYRAFGYHFDVKLLYPLLLEPMFVDFVSEHEFVGDIDLVKEFINKLTDKIDYEHFIELLDIININNAAYDQAIQMGKIDFVSEHTANIKTAKDIVMDMKKNLTRK